MADPAPKARDAAHFATALQFHLLAASGPDTSKDQKRHHLTKAFQSWSALSDRMRALEALAPNCRDAGYAEAAALRELAGRAA